MDQQTDYDRFLVEIGMQPDQAQRIVENESDQQPMPAGFEHVQIKASEIHGQGTFTAKAVDKGAALGPARMGEMRTPIGRYANHSSQPNMKYVAGEGGSIEAIALRHIAADEELTVDYRQVGRVNGSGLQPDPDESIRTAKMRRRAGGLGGAA